MSMLLGALIALGVLVTFHEFGHFWVARRCGVEVIRFSIGFGKPLLRWHDKYGTEFVIAMIPLGGYVKMLDEREEEAAIPEHKLPFAFNRKPVGQRIAIVAAGPIANFILAVILFWLVALIGSKEPIPIIGKVAPESIAAVSGLKPLDEIVAIDGVKTVTWGDIAFQLFGRLGETGNIAVTVKDQQLVEKTYQLAINNWLRGADKPNPFHGIGIEAYRPPIKPELVAIAQDSPAERAGLKAGDLLISLNGTPVADWLTFSEIIQQSPNQVVTVGYLRAGQSYTTSVALATFPEATKKIGYIGVEVKAVWPEDKLRRVNYGPLAAIPKALHQTWSFSVLTLSAIKKMFSGEMSVKNLSGPITIVKVAGSSVESGFTSFLMFLALFSVSLGVFNLLPIPVLDGGHLLFYMIELVRRRPVSEQVQGVALQLGVFLMIAIMLFAIMNDLNWL